MFPASNHTDGQEKTTQDEETDFIRQVGWRALFGFTTRNHIPVLSVALICAAIAAITLPAFAIVYGLVFRQFANFGSGQITGAVLLRNASKYCTYLAALSAINWFANSIYFATYLTFGELQASSARKRIYNALLQKDMAWYDTRQSGIAAFLPAIQAQIRDLQLSTSQPFGEAAQCFFQAMGALIVAFYFSWKLTLVIICTVPLSYLVMAFLSQRLAKRAQEQAQKLQQALKYVTSATNNIETVKCFNGQRFELQRYTAAIARAAGLYTRLANYRSMQIGFMQFFTLSIFVQGFWYGSHLVVTGEKNPGQVITTFWSALIAVTGVTVFLPQFIILQKGKVAGATLRAMIRTSKHDDGTETQGEEKPDRCVGDIEFKKVTFSYPTRPNQIAIRDISVSFPAGDTTFVVGRSGSGKSTLGQLLVRLYQPTAGQISIDGISIQNLESKWLRENITLVEQHSVLFNGSIQHNIALAKKDEHVTRHEVEEATKFALLQQMIQELPDGLETLVGMKGGALSGGQKQRMAVARARLRDTPVLILDESTSALDYVTRSTILQAIRAWRRGKTTIIITHDISQILSNDFVYVLDNAHIVQSGYREAIEAETDSVFRTFLNTEKEEAREEKTTFEHDTSEILSLYSAARKDLSPAPRPVSEVLFGEQFLSPFLSPGRRSSIMNSPDFRRLSISADLERAPSSTTEPSALKLPPFRASEFSSQKQKRHARRFSRLGSVESNRMSQTLSTVRALSHTREISIQLNMEETAAPLKKSRFKRRKHLNLVENSTHAVQQLSAIQIMKTVWSSLPWRSRIALVVATICAIIHSAATPAFGFVFSRLLSTFYTTENQEHQALKYALFILGIAFVDGLSSYGFHFLFDACAQTWINNLKSEAMRRLLIQPREFFDQDENSVSRLAECLDQFAEEARNLPGRFTGIAIVVVSMISIAVVWSLMACWKLTLVALGCGPILYAITAAFNAVSHRWETFANEADEEVGQLLHETFVNIRTVRCLALEDLFRKKYQDATLSALKVGMKRAIYSGSIFGLNYASVLFITALLFYYGSYIISTGEYGPTTIIQVFTILLMSVNHVNFIVNYIPQINAAKDAGSRLIRLARLPTNSHEHHGTIQLHTAGDIILKNVNFTYPTRKNHQVLHDISFSIPRGSCTAIVGSSGSGKSTVAALLLKLYKTGSIDGITAPSSNLTVSKCDIKTLHTATLRSRMAVVSQTPVLFPGTIAENISYGISPSSPQSSPTSIRAAASSAGIAQFIDSLPQGYQTVIGEGGSGLSGGQAQRIAIARALIRSPDVLILDEATSALDAESAGVVRDTILELVMERNTERHDGEWVRAEGQASESRALDGTGRRDMTVVIITHAREMMAIAEHIVMLEKGRVVEEGAFDELRRRRGAFARLLRGDAGE